MIDDGSACDSIGVRPVAVRYASHGLPVKASRSVCPDRPSDRVLDMGCGTGAILGCSPEVRHAGLDMSEEYLRACRRHWGSRGEFHRKELTGTTADVFGEFDIILALGLVHHLDDEQATNLFAIARRTLRPGGG